jgi:hypothetical protein
LTVSDIAFEINIGTSIKKMADKKDGRKRPQKMQGYDRTRPS